MGHGQSPSAAKEAWYDAEKKTWKERKKYCRFPQMKFMVRLAQKVTSWRPLRLILQPLLLEKAFCDHFVKAFHDTYGMPVNITRVLTTMVLISFRES
jgi:dTDP-glucose 4,6-dehydratase